MENLTALLYDPYLDTLGGGERYVLTIADLLDKNGFQVLLAWNDPRLLSVARQRFALALKNVQVDPEYYHLMNQRTDLPTRHKALKNLDLVLVVSDGSVPILFGKKTILHYQVPFTQTNRLQFFNRLKLRTIDHLIVNSRFTKSIIDKTLGINKSQVLYPPVDTTAFKPAKKTRTILNVGRFASPSHSKRQDILIDAFKKLYDQGYHTWQLILAGGQLGRDTVLDELKQRAKDYPIKFIVNPSFSKLQSLYAVSSLYWHAAGFEVDENLNPESVEHFGITTVEAMAARAVPLVVNKGGQKEIVDPAVGYLWDRVDQLLEHTKDLLKKPQKLKLLSQKAQQKASNFDISHFSKNFFKLL